LDQGRLFSKGAVRGTAKMAKIEGAIQVLGFDIGIVEDVR
jgi:hypothetical protein